VRLADGHLTTVGVVKLAGEAWSARQREKVPTSPDELRTDLPDAWIAGTRYQTEVGAAYVPARVVKLCMIEDVEEFTSNLEVHCFIDGNHLRYAQIGIVESRTVEESPVRRPETSAVSTQQNAR